MTSATELRTDPVVAQVLLGACESLVEEADDILERASMGMVIRESRDYCSVVADPSGNVIATGSRDLPAFVGTIQFTIQGVIEWIGEENLREGEVYIVNCPWVGGTHFNDIRLIAPVYVAGELIGFVGACGHIGDVGGMNPGSIAVQAPNAYAEGLRIVPVVFSRDGVINDDIWQLIRANIRVQDVAEGDLRAMLAAVERATERFAELADRYGADVLTTWMSEYQEFGRTRIRDTVAALEDGEYSITDWIDADPITGDPLTIKLTLKVSGDQLIFDFDGTSPQAKGAANAALASTSAIVYVATKYVFPELPVNYGMMSGITIDAPLGTVVNAEYPTAVSAMASTTFDIVAACVFGAFSQVVPERAMAASYNLQSLIIGGHDERWDRDYVSYSWGPGGWGATKDLDGRVGMALYTTTTTNIPCEDEERKVPFVIEEWSFVVDSCGAGRRRGGNCLRRKFRFAADATCTSLAGRGKFPIWGLFGGQPGEAQTASLDRGDGPESVGLLVDNVIVGPGDRLIYKNGGGGGYGPPAEREPELVLEDVLDGWISPEAARDTYRVVLDEIADTSLTTTYELDEAGTERLRSTEAAKGGE